MESFVLKVNILGPHLPFQERNAVTRAGFTIIWHSTSKGFCAQMVRLFWSLLELDRYISADIRAKPIYRIGVYH